MKTSELSGRALAYAVGLAENCYMETWHTKSIAILFPGAPRAVPWNPHTDWAQGGPIIEREKYDLSWMPKTQQWYAQRKQHGIDGFVTHIGFGSTLLIAAMRCYVASKLGDEIEIPEELK